MKKVALATLLITATLLFTLAVQAAPAGAKVPVTPVPAVPAVAALATPPEPHPHIAEALEAMRNAKHHLETADHDFGGHRVKAIEHLNAAIAEAEICMREK